MTWGIEALDEKTKGLMGGELTIIAGRHSRWQNANDDADDFRERTSGCPGWRFLVGDEQGEVAPKTLYTADVEHSHREHDAQVSRLMSTFEGVPELKRVSQVLAKLPIYVDRLRR